MKIKAALAREPDRPFEIVTCDLDEPGPREVLVRIEACGICHLDVAVKSLHTPLTLPRVLGHEGAGVVEAIGRDVTHVVPGDHVVMSYGSCGTCRHCSSGSPAYCVDSFDINFRGQRGRGATHSIGGRAIDAGFFAQSSFSTHAIATDRNTIRVNRDLPLELMAPLGCGFQTGMGSVLIGLRPGAGDSIAVFGCGSVGMAAIIAARISGCAKIVAVDTKPQRLSLAIEMGATHAVDGTVQDVLSEISVITGRGADFAFDTTGVPDVVDQALQCLRIRGVLGLVAPSKPGQKLAFESRSVVSSGKTVRGIIQGDAVSSEFIPRMIDFYRRGELPLRRLVTTFGFDEINEAIEGITRGDVLKAVLTMDGKGI